MFSVQNTSNETEDINEHGKVDPEIRYRISTSYVPTDPRAQNQAEEEEDSIAIYWNVNRDVDNDVVPC